MLEAFVAMSVLKGALVAVLESLVVTEELESTIGTMLGTLIVVNVEDTLVNVFETLVNTEVDTVILVAALETLVVVEIILSERVSVFELLWTT